MQLLASPFQNTNKPGEMRSAKLASFLLAATVAILPPLIGFQTVSCSQDGILCRIDAQPELMGAWTFAFALFCYQGWTSRSPEPQSISSNAARAFYITIGLVPVFIVGLIGLLLSFEGRGTAQYGAALIGVFVSGIAFILRTAIQAVLVACDHYETQTMEEPGQRISPRRNDEAGVEKKFKKIDFVKINVPDSQKCYSKDRESISPPSYKSAINIT